MDIQKERSSSNSEDVKSSILYKTRPCKWIVMEDPDSCKDGDDCFFAHSAAELKPCLQIDREEFAEHWQGALVAIGVVERALFWDVPPPGTRDVVCNRCSPLGNPFAFKFCAPGEDRLPFDEYGWCPGEHEYLCEAFGDYLSAVLDTKTSETLEDIVNRISRKRRLGLSPLWVALELERWNVVAALDNLIKCIANGERLRLLCHCRPKVRCHTEKLKAHLESFAQPSVHPTCENGDRIGSSDHMQRCLWPGSEGFGPKCAVKRCNRSGRALDPGNMKAYCAQCWSQLYLDTKWQAENLPNSLQIGGNKDDTDVPNKQKLCFYMRSQGKCSLGKKCWFSHDMFADDAPVLQEALPVGGTMKRKDRTDSPEGKREVDCPPVEQKRSCWCASRRRNAKCM